MQAEQPTSSQVDSLTQQNKLYYAKQKLKYMPLFSELQYNKQQLSDLSTKYDGYMQIFKRKSLQAEPTEYFSSSFLNDLKQKRNNMFSDEIIQKMVKGYELSEYGSNVDWRKIASNGIDLSRTKFAGNWQLEIEDYKTIMNRMLQP